MRIVTLPTALLSLALVISACSRTSKIPASDGSASDTTNAGSVAIKQLNDQCTPRVLGPDPGPTPPPKYGMPPPLPPPMAGEDKCTKHSDCTERAHGRCERTPAYETQYHGTRINVPTQNGCIYDECTSDDECRRNGTYEPKKDLVCFCGTDQNRCSFANCRHDSDCPAPYLCGYNYCHSKADQCQSEKDCKKAGEHCSYNWTAKHFMCEVPPLPMPG